MAELVASKLEKGRVAGLKKEETVLKRVIVEVWEVSMVEGVVERLEP